MPGSWILDAVPTLGDVGIALLMCLENLFPPIPSELIMPLGGVLAVQGEGQSVRYLLQPRVARIRDVVGPVSTVVLLVLVGWYVWRVATSRTRQAGEAPD